MRSLVPNDVPGMSSGVSAVSAGDSVTCAITSTNAAQCWGKNGNGQLGNGTGGPLVESRTPQDVVGLTTGVTGISVGYLYSCAVVSGGAKCWGSNIGGELGNAMSAGFESNIPVSVAGLTTGVAAIAASAGHVCARTTTGALKCWGPGGGGELGNNLTNDSNVPVNVVSFP